MLFLLFIVLLTGGYAIIKNVDALPVVHEDKMRKSSTGKSTYTDAANLLDAGLIKDRSGLEICFADLFS